LRALYDVNDVAAAVIIGSRSTHPSQRPSSVLSQPITVKSVTALFYGIDTNDNLYSPQMVAEQQRK